MHKLSRLTGRGVAKFPANLLLLKDEFPTDVEGSHRADVIICMLANTGQELEAALWLCLGIVCLTLLLSYSKELSILFHSALVEMLGRTLILKGGNAKY